MSFRQDTPSPRRFSSLARHYNLVPVVRELMGDLETPVSALLKLRAGYSRSFLLESVEGARTGGATPSSGQTLGDASALAASKC